MSKIYQLKITLKEVKPPVWRRLEVPADLKLDKLEAIILTAMDWGGGHLTSFEFDREEYVNDTAFMFEELDMEGLPMSKTRLQKVLTAEKQKGLFTYDFGDDWRHEVLLEKILESEKGVKYPRCTAGKRACPPDDCGGPWGYPDFLKAINDPKHPEHEEMLDWIGGEFDAEAFDLEGVNGRLR
ncbi:MAG: plasmid pRiA4b ORF-3 family protein [Saprospiraceae bacterium]|nr:plasmid pRiA4b ORF-3 family protein [Saprospiraceae bacterium]MCF8249255.1 plasmid pRiA4b ORF-3 family protein [Saprospiraceae bacterium]MCF8281177.1 plasmid pRiA4b ORF-3 family protein [Bacteroidales bacterium]MCF8311468.1 plasmid pRiA4b ORF-3 family protein [Saprospiraceae bacterium]MCF8439874.1 plasmid pRiA4b ORF-3 family protein [Saprospiraceae bacterium]